MQGSGHQRSSRRTWQSQLGQQGERERKAPGSPAPPHLGAASPCIVPGSRTCRPAGFSQAFASFPRSAGRSGDTAAVGAELVARGGGVLPPGARTVWNRQYGQYGRRRAAPRLPHRGNPRRRSCSARAPSRARSLRPGGGKECLKKAKENAGWEAKLGRRPAAEWVGPGMPAPPARGSPRAWDAQEEKRPLLAGRFHFPSRGAGAAGSSHMAGSCPQEGPRTPPASRAWSPGNAPWPRAALTSRQPRAPEYLPSKIDGGCRYRSSGAPGGARLGLTAKPIQALEMPGLLFPLHNPHMDPKFFPY